MTIQELVDLVKDLSLNSIEAKSFYIGNTWDQSSGKGDIYPCVWFEFPVMTAYQTVDVITKELTFSLDFLTLAKSDNTVDEINMISHMEVLADLFLYYLRQQKQYLSLVDKPIGLTVKNINADNAVGIRLDIKINTGRECPPK
jgi:hypothetical protein